MDKEKGFQAAAVVLFREAFEGRPEGQSYTWFVEKHEGIFEALDSVDAVRASKKPGIGLSSIAGHTNHILYALQLGNSRLGPNKPKGSWEESWNRQAVDAPGWEMLREIVRIEYKCYLAWLESDTEWDEDSAYLEHLAILPHMAYHLGAIRQLIWMV